MDEVMAPLLHKYAAIPGVVTFYFLPFTFYFLPFTFYFLPFTFYFLLLFLKVELTNLFKQFKLSNIHMPESHPVFRCQTMSGNHFTMEFRRISLIVFPTIMWIHGM